MYLFQQRTTTKAMTKNNLQCSIATLQ